jgi:hypothetical protein
MGAKLQTEITLNSTEIQREYAKAADVVKRYTADVEQQGAKTLARARGEIDALRLEAAGHREAAAALREKVMVQEQAERLAKRAGLSMTDAVRMTQRRLELEKQVAQAQSGAGTGASRVGGGVGLPGMALTAEEMNRTYLATEKVNTQLRNVKRAGQYGSMGFLAVSQAAEDAQYGIKGVLNNIPQAVMGFGGSMGLAGALSLTAVAAVTLYPVMRRLTGAMEAERVKKTAEAWREAGRRAKEAIEEIRRASEDQKAVKEYEVQLVQALRQEAGSVSTLIDFYKNRAKWGEMSLEMEEKILAARKELAEVKGDMFLDTAPQKALEEMNRQLEAKKNILKETFSEESQNLERLEAKRKDAARIEQAAQEEILKLKERIARETEKEKAARTQVDLLEKNKATFGEKLATEIITLQPNYGTDVEEVERKKMVAATAQQNAIEKRKKSLEEELKLAEGYATVQTKAYGETIANYETKIKASNESANALDAEIKGLEVKLKVEAELKRLRDEAQRVRNEAARAEYQLEVSILKAKLQGEDAQVKALERNKRIREETLKIMKDQQDLTRNDAEKIATEKVNTEDAIKAKDSAKELAEKRMNERLKQLEFAQEMNVLRLRSKGQKEMADALQKEYELRANAVRLAKDAGVTEEKALALLREKAALEKGIEAKENKRDVTRRGGIRRSEGGLPGSRLAAARVETRNYGNWMFRPGQRTGLQNSLRQGGKGPDKHQASAKSYYDRSLQLNEEMIGLVKKLTVF